MSRYEHFLVQFRIGLPVRLHRSFVSRLGAAMIVSLLIAPSPAEAQARDAQQGALDDFVAASMLVIKCFSWQLDLDEAQTRFSALALQPRDWQAGGRHGRFFSERLSYYSTLLSRMNRTQACAAAEGAFGPSGHVRKGWMRPQ